MPYDFRDLDPESLPSLALAYDFVSPSYDEVVERLTLSAVPQTEGQDGSESCPVV